MHRVVLDFRYRLPRRDEENPERSLGRAGGYQGALPIGGREFSKEALPGRLRRFAVPAEDSAEPRPEPEEKPDRGVCGREVLQRQTSCRGTSASSECARRSMRSYSSGVTRTASNPGRCSTDQPDRSATALTGYAETDPVCRRAAAKANSTGLLTVRFNTFLGGEPAVNSEVREAWGQRSAGRSRRRRPR